MSLQGTVKQTTAIVAMLVTGVLTALLSQWWHEDMKVKDEFTHNWYTKVDRHVDVGDKSLVEFEMMKSNINEFKKDFKEMQSDIRVIRDYIAEEKGRNSNNKK